MHACNFKQAFYPLYKLLYRMTVTTQNYFFQAFCSVPGCQACMCKRSISFVFAPISGENQILGQKLFCSVSKGVRRRFPALTESVI